MVSTIRLCVLLVNPLFAVRGMLPRCGVEGVPSLKTVGKSMGYGEWSKSVHYGLGSMVTVLGY